jgi:hypothetical protein
LATGSLVPESRTAAARVLIDPCISWIRKAGLIFMPLVDLDVGLEDGPGAECVVGDETPDLDELIDDPDLMLFFFTGSEEAAEEVGTLVGDPSERMDMPSSSDVVAVNLRLATGGDSTTWGESSMSIVSP